jgi:RHS repeat-associated protein
VRWLLAFGLFIAISSAGAPRASAASSRAATWGKNYFGNLGYGDLEGPEVCETLPFVEGGGKVSCAATPVEVSGLSGVVDASRSGHGLAALADGTVMAWGVDSFGQLGDGETGYGASRSTPVEVSGLTGVTAVSAGGTHSLALLSNGTVKAWGNNEFGQLGDGIAGLGTSSNVPVSVKNLTGVTAISAGGAYSLALLSNGTVMAWGDNNEGELGVEGGSADVPVLVSGLSGVVAISAGGGHALAALSNGSVVAWGSDAGGELGNGTDGGVYLPATVPGLTGVKAVAAGPSESYAVVAGGAVEAWGSGELGQLGNGGGGYRYHSDVPGAVTGVSGATAAVAGDTGYALLGNGTVMAWGSSGSGGLGNGSSAGGETCEEASPEEREKGKTAPYPCSTNAVTVSGISGAVGISDGLAFGNVEVPHPRHEELEGEKNPGAPKYARTCTGKPVNCATGNESVSQTDLTVPGLGVSLTLARSYNAESAAAQSTPETFGYGWSTSFSEHLIVDTTSGTITVVQANGSTVTFASTGRSGAQTAPAWAQATLNLNSDGTYTYTVPSEEASHFSAQGRLLSVSDRNGNATTLARNAEGRLESISDPAGRKLTFTYNTEGLVAAATDPMGHVVKYLYEAGNLVSVTLPGETSPRWQFKYDGSHRLTKLTDGRGGATTNEYDSANRVISQTDPSARTLTFEYAPYETKIANHATGAVTRELFSEGYEPEAITHAYGTSSATTESMSYNVSGDVTSKTDGDGHTTKYGYNANGDRTSARDADGHETKWAYDTAHNVVSTTSAKGEATNIKRDAHGNVETVERPAPASQTQVTKYKYSTSGELESVTNPLERTWSYGYDSQGDRTSEADPEGDKRTWQYNEDSQLTSTVAPRGNVEGAEAAKYTTKFERDAQGRETVVTDPLGHITKDAYDADGNLEAITDPNGHKTKYTYDADNEQTKTEKPTGTITETGYDGAGQVTTQTDGNKHTTKYVRNVLEEVTETVDPLGRKSTAEYDKTGNLTKRVDPAKRTTSSIFDAANLLKETTYSDGKTHLVQYEYDADGERTKMIDGSGTTTLTYDQLDRLTESKDGHGDIVKYEYDLGSQLTKIIYPSGKAVTRTFDNAGRLQKVTDWLTHTTTFGYDRNSNQTTTTWPTGTSGEDKYTYNEADELGESKMSKGAETLASLAYTRDAAGQVKAVTSKGLPGEEKPAYEYDANNRLTKGPGTPYEYDPANNPTKIGASADTYNADDQLEKGTTAAYAYDEAGERTKTTPTTGAATSAGYDEAGNLISVELAKEGKKAGFTDAYTYDGNGLRMSQTIAGAKTFLSWEPADGLPLLLNDGSSSYIYGPGDLPIEQISSGGTITYLHHDQQGSTRLLTGSTGTVTGKCTYGAYGTPTCEGTTTTPLGYDAQYTSADTGLQYLRARNYDPSTGQFTSADPVTAITGEPYSFTADNPVNSVDPSGLLCAFGYCLGWHPVNPLKATANFFAGFANAVVGAATLGSVSVPAPFCGRGLNWSYGIGQVTAGAEAGVLVGPEAEAGYAAGGAGPLWSPIGGGQLTGLAATYVGNAGHASLWQLFAGAAGGGTIGGIGGNVAGSFASGASRTAATAAGGLGASSLVESPQIGGEGSPCGCS